MKKIKVESDIEFVGHICERDIPEVIDMVEDPDNPKVFMPNIQKRYLHFDKRHYIDYMRSKKVYYVVCGYCEVMWCKEEGIK